MIKLSPGRTSPCRMAGTQFSWTGVGLLMPSCWHCLTSQSERPSEEKSAIFTSNSFTTDLTANSVNLVYQKHFYITIFYWRNTHPRAIPLPSLSDDVMSGVFYFFFRLSKPEKAKNYALLPSAGHMSVSVAAQCKLISMVLADKSTQQCFIFSWLLFVINRNTLSGHAEYWFLLLLLLFYF